MGIKHMDGFDANVKINKSIINELYESENSDLDRMTLISIL